jgi:hypothetical protein
MDNAQVVRLLWKLEVMGVKGQKSFSLSSFFFLPQEAAACFILG